MRKASSFCDCPGHINNNIANELGAQMKTQCLGTQSTHETINVHINWILLKLPNLNNVTKFNLVFHSQYSIEINSMWIAADFDEAHSLRGFPLHIHPNKWQRNTFIWISNGFYSLRFDTISYNGSQHFIQLNLARRFNSITNLTWIRATSTWKHHIFTIRPKIETK